MDELKDIHIGATLSYTYSEPFHSADKSGKIKVQWVPKDIQNFKKLLLGRIQLFPQFLETGYYQIKTNFTSDQIKLFTHHSKPLKVTPSSLIISKKARKGKHLIALFDNGLKQLKESGKYKKYFEDSRKGEYIIKK